MDFDHIEQFYKVSGEACFIVLAHFDNNELDQNKNTGERESGHEREKARERERESLEANLEESETNTGNTG